MARASSFDHDLFFGHGAKVGPDVVISDRGNGKLGAVLRRSCGRCGGAGGAEQWRHTGWTCFQCSGAGVDPAHPTETLPVYTAEKLAKLISTRAKLQATRERKHAAAQAKIDAEAATVRDAFEAANADILPWLRAEVARIEERTGYGPGGADGFLPDLLRRGEKFASWSEAQSNALRASKAKQEAAAAVRESSRYVGTVGERLTVSLTVERQSEHSQPVFGASWKSEILYITTLRDERGNAFVVKSTGFSPEVGTTFLVKGTVKEHSTFRDQQQTVLTRVVDVEADKARKTERKAQKAADDIASAEWAAKHAAGGAVW